MFPKIPDFLRKDLIAVAEASEIKDNPQVVEFVVKLKALDIHAKATADEIEEYDELYEALVP